MLRTLARKHYFALLIYTFYYGAGALRAFLRLPKTQTFAATLLHLRFVGESESYYAQPLHKCKAIAYNFLILVIKKWN